MSGSNIIRIVFVALIAGCIGFGVLLNKSESQKGLISIMPEVKTFLEKAPQGKPTATQSVPDWAEGLRQRVIFSNGKSLLFYIKGNEVVTVYSDGAEGRTEIFRKATEPQNKVVPKLAKPSASYAIIDLTGSHADVLVLNGFTQATPRAMREKFAYEILKREKLTSLSLYMSKEAMKADYSASYAKQNPQAKRGALGSIFSNNFTDPVKVY
jgi:hypothetical protein